MDRGSFLRSLFCDTGEGVCLRPFVFAPTSCLNPPWPPPPSLPPRTRARRRKRRLHRKRNTSVNTATVHSAAANTDLAMNVLVSYPTFFGYTYYPNITYARCFCPQKGHFRANGVKLRRQTRPCGFRHQIFHDRDLAPRGACALLFLSPFRMCSSLTDCFSSQTQRKDLSSVRNVEVPSFVETCSYATTVLYTPKTVECHYSLKEIERRAGQPRHRPQRQPLRNSR